MERYYTVTQVAEITGIPRRTIYDAIRDGRLRVLVPNGNRRGMRVSEAAWREYVRECERPGA